MLVSAFVLLALAMALPQAAFAQGIGGYALNFDGNNDYVDIGDLGIGDSYTDIEQVVTS